MAWENNCARGHNRINFIYMYVDACECMLMHVRDVLYDKQAGEIKLITNSLKRNIKFMLSKF